MKRILRWLMLGVALVALTACGGGGSSSTGNNSSQNAGNEGGSNAGTLQTRMISGYVVDDPVPDAKVYIDFGDGNRSTVATTDKNGYFTIRLSDEDMDRIDPEIPEGADAPQDGLLIVAEKNGKILRGALSRNLDDISDVYITVDTEAYAEFLDSIGAFSTLALLDFYNELDKGHIRDGSRYAALIKDLRADVKSYFGGAEKATAREIFEKAYETLDKSILAQLTKSDTLVLDKNVMSGGDILLPDGFHIESDDIDIVSKGNGRYTIGDGNDPDETVYLKVSQGDIFGLIELNIKEKSVTTLVSQSVSVETGGLIESEEVTLKVPSGAVNKAIDITINKVNTEGETADGRPLLELEPSGTVFDLPVTLVIHYDKFGIDDPEAVQWKYGSLKEGYDNAEIINIDRANKTIVLGIDHFSDLVIRSINFQEFLDLGPNFLMLVPRRAYDLPFLHNHRRDYYTTNDILYQQKIITNKVFNKSSFSGRQGNGVSGGYCAQAVKNIFTTLKIGQRITNGGFQALQNGTGIMENIFNSIDNSKRLPDGVRDVNQCQSGDVVFIDMKNSVNAGHTVTFSSYMNNYSEFIAIESNSKGYKTFWKKNRSCTYAISSIDGNYTMIRPTNSNQSIHYICVAPTYFSLAPYNLNNYKVILNNESLGNGIGGTYNRRITEKPYFYYLVSEIGNGVTSNSNDYNYAPDLLPVAPLRVRFNEQTGVGTIQNSEDALYEIYAENSAQLTFTNQSYGPEITTYLIWYPGSANKEYETRDSIEDLLNKKRNGEISYLGGYTTIAGRRYALNGEWDAVKNFTNDQIIDGLTQKTSKTISNASVGLTSNENIRLTNSALGIADLYRFEADGVVAQNFVAQNSAGAYVTSPTLQKILFSPIVIDDYYVNWGRDNTKNMQPKPIGFWNSYGYNLEFKGTYTSSSTLEAGKIYKSDDAINGYFMTLGKDKEAQWHFALAGNHAIYVNVPTGDANDISNATYKLHLNGEVIELKVDTSSDVETKLELENSAFSNWYVLYQDQDGRKITSFNLTGNDFLEVTANGITVVDGIRLEGKSDVLQLINGKVNTHVQDPIDEDRLMYVVSFSIHNRLGPSITRMIKKWGDYYIPIQGSLTKPITLDVIFKTLPVPTKKIETKDLRSVGEVYEDETVDVSSKYMPVKKTITINPGDKFVDLGKVVFQPFGTEVQSTKMFKIKKTGQTLCYSKTDPTKTTDCFSDDALHDDGWYAVVKGLGVEPSYSRDNEKGILKDMITGIIWEDKKNYYYTESLQDAEKYCSSLNIAGLNWELPKLVDLFFNTQILGYSTSFTGGKYSLLSVDGKDCYEVSGKTLSAAYNGNNYSVKCASYDDSNILVNDNFIRTSYNSIIDANTNLEWSDAYDLCIDDDLCFDKFSNNIIDAINYCENSNLGNHDDWRLPNINELVSSLHIKFKTCNEGSIYSSTRNTNQSVYIYDHHNVFSDYIDRRHCVRCVRGGLVEAGGEPGEIDTQGGAENAGPNATSYEVAGEGEVTVSSSISPDPDLGEE